MVLVLLAAACGSGDDDEAGLDAGGDGDADTDADAGAVVGEPLEIRFLGVAGFLVRSGGEAFLTAPMFSNPDLTTVTIGRVASDGDLVDRFTEGVDFGDVRAIVTGHAHYDHLMDVPPVWEKTPQALIVGNDTMRHILAAFAPDRDPSCEGTTPPRIQIPRDVVVALDDPTNDLVDWRLCDGAGANAGGWREVPGSHLRVRGFCSSHPAQFAGFHFGEGSYDADLCEPPSAGGEWREGQTISLLVDFLDPETGAPRFRLYYQDAPTDAPVGHVSPEVLAEKTVDVALLCVGNFDQVEAQPTAIIENLRPRYVVSGHWESFFQTQDQPLVGLPGHDLELYEQRAADALPGPEAPALVDGEPQETRHWMPDPGTTFRFDPE